MLKNTHQQYGSIAKFFHWLIFILIVFMLLVGYFMDDVSDKALRGTVMNLHKLTGLTILTLMVLRAMWALMNPKPDLPPNTPRWEFFAERVTHYSLYLLVIAMPLAGWSGSMAAGHPPHFFATNFNLPIEKNKAHADLFFSIHSVLAVIIITVVSLHILAALWHHFVKKDNVLKRMMPFVD